MGACAASIVEERFDAETNALRLVDLFCDVVQRVIASR